MKDRKREIVIMSVQILLCAVYVIFQFAQEAKSIQKSAAKIREARTKEQIRLERQRYRIKRAKTAKKRESLDTRT